MEIVVSTFYDYLKSYLHCTMQYYSAFKEKEILLFVTIWMNLEDIRLSEKGQTQ